MPKEYFSAVDIGTNSFHLIIVEAVKNSFRIIDREREVIRLASGQGENLSYISEEEMKRGIAVLKEFKKLANFYKAEFRAVATSAVREALNRQVFIDRVLRETGINIDVIEGGEEAKLIYSGASKALQLKNKKALCIDIGGGSTEIILADKENVIFAESLKIGAVRLTKKFFPGFLITDNAVSDCEKYIKDIIAGNNKIINSGYDIAVGTSGTIQNTASIIHFDKYRSLPGSLNAVSFNKEELIKTAEKVLSNLSLEERLKIFGLEQKRADIYPSGLLILKNIFKIFGIDKITVSEYALREGIIINMIEKMSNK